MTMIKRLNIYFKEMYPVLPRLFVGYLLFFEVYFLVILTYGTTEIRIGHQEIIGGLTIFSFLLALRIADDFKDYETDLRLFAHRPLPSGRVKKRDLAILLGALATVIVVLNLLFMDNLIFFTVLVLYGLLMSFWFFQKYRIQKNLLLALVTHNPVQIIMNLYIIAFSCNKYGISLLLLNNIVIALTLYFPGLIWEIGRKIRAPKDETEYVTYSKLFGYKKPVWFILAVMFFDMLCTSFLVYQLFWWAPITVVACYAYLVYNCLRFTADPDSFALIKKIERYMYIAEGSVVVLIAVFLFLMIR